MLAHFQDLGLSPYFRLFPLLPGPQGYCACIDLHLAFRGGGVLLYDALVWWGVLFVGDVGHEALLKGPPPHFFDNLYVVGHLFPA